MEFDTFTSFTSCGVALTTLFYWLLQHLPRALEWIRSLLESFLQLAGLISSFQKNLAAKSPKL